MTSQSFRERHRAYGRHIPIEDVPLHLANGWRVIEDIATSELHELLMAAPISSPQTEATR